MKTNLITALLLCLAVSAWGQDPPILRIDTSRMIVGDDYALTKADTALIIDTIFVDTARYYAKVDTCLTCPEGWGLGIHDTLWPNHVNLAEAELWCRRDTMNVWTLLEPPDTTYKTTWLPKVQVWLTDDEIKKLKALLK